MKKFINVLPSQDCDLTINVLFFLMSEIGNDNNIEIIASESSINSIKKYFDSFSSEKQKTLKYTFFDDDNDKWVFISDNYVYISNGA